MMYGKVWSVCVLAVCGSMAMACAVESEGLPSNDEVMEANQEEETGQSESALNYLGYCNVGSNGLLTGQCRVCSNMCRVMTDNECPVGVAPGKLVAFSSSCGAIRYDSTRRCTAYASSCW